MALKVALNAIPIRFRKKILFYENKKKRHFNFGCRNFHTYNITIKKCLFPEKNMSK